jgi:hypothetical protein
VNYIVSETIQGNAKKMNSRRLKKTPKLNRSGLQENMHLEGTRGQHAKAEPSLGPAQADWPYREADRAPLASIRPCFGKVPPPPLRVNLNHFLGRFDHTATDYPSGLYKQPHTPMGHGMHISEDHHHQAKTGEEEDTSEIG